MLLKVFLSICSCFSVFIGFAQQEIIVNYNSKGRVFEGLGSLSAGASTRLLIDYPEPYRSQILDLLFKPMFGASLQHLKVEIGGDINSTCGTEPSHARTREEMLHPEEAFYNRGWEWWLMQEAKRRNKNIYLDCLEWGLPGWVGNGTFYSDDNINYIIAFIKGARKYHSLNINYTGVHNERMYDVPWIKKLRKALDTSGLSKVKIVAADLCCNEQWKIADDMKKDTALKNAIAVIGDHYPEKDKAYNSSANAKSIDLPLWDNEGGPWRGDWEGFKYLAKMFNRNYIEGRMTKDITWSLITSYYDNLALPNSGMMKANSPWSGHYEVQPAFWAFAHTTQFAQPGWKYVDEACGYLSKGGSFVTLKSNETNNADLSMIIETMDAPSPQLLKVFVSNLFANRTFYIWRSVMNGGLFQDVQEVTADEKGISILLDNNALYSITTTKGQRKGSFKSIPDVKPFPFPYFTDFNSDKPGKSPKYFSDQGGAFEVVLNKKNNKRYLEQKVVKPGNEWEGDSSLVQTYIGDTSWCNYTVSVDVYLKKDSGSYAAVIGRATELHRSHKAPDAYWFKLYSSGKWELLQADSVHSNGWCKIKQDQWNNIGLKMRDNFISAFINRNEVAKVFTTKYSHGLCGIGSSYDKNVFNNFSVNKASEDVFTK